MAGLAALMCLPAAAAEPGAPPATAADRTYVIPVKGAIEWALVFVIRRGVAQAEEEEASAVVFEIDTHGGWVDATEEIVNILQNISVPTYSFVERNAISAGAVIALATDHIYMAPGSRIGAVTPVAGSGEKTSEAVEEKYHSFVRSVVRSVAQQKGHDPDLAEAMVDRRREYKVGDKIISREGEVLTLTNVDAEQPVGEGKEKKPLLSEGTVKDFDELLIKIGREKTTVERLEVSPTEQLARWLKHPALTGLLLTLGVLGIYVELRTPGFGVPGILGILCLIAFFWGHYIAGLAGMEEIILFLIGLALLMVEIFVIPGFGITGAVGILLMLAAIFSAMVQHYPGLPWYSVSWPNFQEPILILSAVVVATFLLALLLGRFLPHTPFFRRLVLETSAGPVQAAAVSAAPGGALVGRKGVTLTALRPAGTALFGDNRVSVVSDGEYVEPDKPVRVVEVSGNRVVVAPVEEA